MRRNRGGGERDRTFDWPDDGLPSRMLPVEAVDVDGHGASKREEPAVGESLEEVGAEKEKAKKKQTSIWSRSSVESSISVWPLSFLTQPIDSRAVVTASVAGSKVKRDWVK